MGYTFFIKILDPQSHDDFRDHILPIIKDFKKQFHAEFGVRFSYYEHGDLNRLKKDDPFLVFMMKHIRFHQKSWDDDYVPHITDIYTVRCVDTDCIICDDINDSYQELEVDANCGDEWRDFNDICWPKDVFSYKDETMTYNEVKENAKRFIDKNDFTNARFLLNILAKMGRNETCIIG